MYIKYQPRMPPDKYPALNTTVLTEKMARRPARNLVIPSKALITWTRFYLPRNQEWPVWAGHEDIYSGPLLDLGIRSLRLRRMVDDPEQAAYIIGMYVLLSSPLFAVA